MLLSDLKNLYSTFPFVGEVNSYLYLKMEKRMKYQQLDLPLSLKNFETNGFFTGYACIFDVIDQHREQVAKGAFQKSLETWKARGQMPKMLWQHDQKRPIGFWQSLIEDERGLLVKGQFLLDLKQGYEAYTLLKNGVVDGLSIGFMTTKSRKDAVMKTRVLEEIDLYEVSLVTFAANPLAKVMDVKAIEEEEQDLLRQLGRLKEGIRNQVLGIR